MYRLYKIKDLRGYRFFQNFRWDEANCRLFNQNNLIYGWNGSGKTTLLYMPGGLEQPTYLKSSWAIFEHCI